MYQNPTIVAIATAQGRGGIGVVRLSGADLQPVMQALFGRILTARHAHYLPFVDEQHQLIDEGIALYFKAPHSYTGEDVLELQGHGGAAVLQRLLKRCLNLSQYGIRLAEPGEFTQRAFLNGRLDLAQAEAVADLIDASSESAARSAMASLSGEFSRLIYDLADRIVHLRVLVEATLDFPEEEIEFLEKYDAIPQLEGIQQHLSQVLETSRQGMILREGVHIVLAGQPNVGKSSLLNALAGDDIAIVTPVAGTTRDRVVQQIHIDGVPLHIVDTAGLRDTQDLVERIGIERTWAEIHKADVILHLRAADQVEITEDIQQILDAMPTKTPRIEVLNKIDLLSVDKLAQLQEQVKQTSNKAETLLISAKDGRGLDQLKQQLLAIVGWQSQGQTPWLARQRHIFALEKAAEHLANAREHARFNDSVLDLFAEELRLAHESLNQITGEFSSDDLLGEIFSSFCIGK